ncbi:MAG: peptidase M24 [Acidiferrobacteraceae bacterium]|nr:peptidase M24 [Acidiferrobacteraceae bacterium]|tara:strand:- start:2412 stop:3668 length:1257 start_codon:yes stop_codon:yes gene_type:complete
MPSSNNSHNSSAVPEGVVQHGAMDYSRPPVNLDVVRRYRLDRLRQEMMKHDVAGLLLFDPLNTRYATDSSNMQIWCTHYETRCVFVALEGPVILFDYGPYPHLTDGLSLVDEHRAIPPFYYFAAGDLVEERVREFAIQIDDLISNYGGGNRRLAIDRLSFIATDAIREKGLTLLDGQAITERARSIKSSEEIVLMEASMAVCEAGCRAMEDALVPGITENALWAQLHETNIRLGGEWIETRLLSSGPRTNPWFRECSMRPIEEGDLVSFDTDLIGPYGYCSDMSRSWLCGDKPSDEQRRLYSLAYEQIETNIAIVKAGLSFAEISEKCWSIPEEFISNRYSVLMHGVGLADEYPSIKHSVDYDTGAYNGVLEEGMTICVESFIGAYGGREGVKLEEQLIVTGTGVKRMSTYPYKLDWL